MRAMCFGFLKRSCDREISAYESAGEGEVEAKTNELIACFDEKRPNFQKKSWLI